MSHSSDDLSPAFLLSLAVTAVMEKEEKGEEPAADGAFLLWWRAAVGVALTTVYKVYDLAV